MTTAPAAQRDTNESPDEAGRHNEPDAGPKRHGRVLVVDAEPPLASLIEEWLAPEGLLVRAATSLPGGGTTVIKGPGAASGNANGYDLVIVDLPFPRRGGVDSIRKVAENHPGVPIIALSPTFFASVDACGTLSRSLGCDCVAAKPTSRETLLRAVKKLLPT